MKTYFYHTSINLLALRQSAITSEIYITYYVCRLRNKQLSMVLSNEYEYIP